MSAQLAATVIFIVMFVLIVSERIERHIVTLGCALLTLVVVFGLCMQSSDAVLEALSFHSFENPVELLFPAIFGDHSQYGPSVAAAVETAEDDEASSRCCCSMKTFFNGGCSSAPPAYSSEKRRF